MQFFILSHNFISYPCYLAVASEMFKLVVLERTRIRSSSDASVILK